MEKEERPRPSAPVVSPVRRPFGLCLSCFSLPFVSRLSSPASRQMLQAQCSTVEKKEKEKSTSC